MHLQRIACRLAPTNKCSIAKFSPMMTQLHTNAVKGDIGEAPQSKLTGMTAAKHWTFERYFNIAFMPMWPLAMLTGTMATDMLLVSFITIHTYWGVENVIRDYSMDRLYGPNLRKYAIAVWKLVCFCVWLGFLYFSQHDVGFTKGLRTLWTL
ncbi:hypothetical protein Ciccas_010996 [Cichlidogyrus casuarinus]|uniref:Succinate dehydrogenase [ubiquinone] cytochrome b small subunit n=1 Tax=Cichlidogyrus casuarinus TaxID=1844966 RepID=A0ABD2PSI7_9PLAT